MTWVYSAFAVSAAAMVLGIRRSRGAAGSGVFHPAVFPVAYVALATLLPVWWLETQQEDLGYVTRDLVTVESTRLVSLAVIGFALGASAPFKRASASPGGVVFNPRVLTQMGRVLILFPLVSAFLGWRQGEVVSRGEAQDVFTAADTLSAAAMIAVPAAMTLILAGSVHSERLMGRFDWALFGALVILLSLNGKRAAALSGALLIMVYLADRRRATLRLFAAFGVILATANWVLSYRSEAAALDDELDATEGALRDLGSVLLTTAETDRLLAGNYLDGSTILAGLVRQLPSPIANSLLGPPTDTGSYVFRVLANTHGDQGMGFSIPAEGVMNFGASGAFSLPFVLGLVLAFFYSRRDLVGSKVKGWIYPVLVATLPFGWRADVLGLVKGVLYPGIAMFVALILARSAMRFWRRDPNSIRSTSGSRQGVGPRLTPREPRARPSARPDHSQVRRPAL